MSEVFELCESDFKKSIRVIQQSLAVRNKEPKTFETIKENLQSAEQQLSKMSIEYSSTRQKNMKERVDIYKKELQTYKKQYEKNMLIFNEQQRANQLFLEATKQKSGYSTNQKLIQGKRVMYENLEINDNVNLKLKEQTDTLTGAREKMDVINSDLTAAHKILNSIKTKMEKNKLVMYIVVGVLVFTLTLVIYSYI